MPISRPCVKRELVRENTSQIAFARKIGIVVQKTDAPPQLCAQAPASLQPGALVLHSSSLAEFIRGRLVGAVISMIEKQFCVFFAGAV